MFAQASIKFLEGLISSPPEEGFTGGLQYTVLVGWAWCKGREFYRTESTSGYTMCVLPKLVDGDFQAVGIDGLKALTDLLVDPYGLHIKREQYLPPPNVFNSSRKPLLEKNWELLQDRCRCRMLWCYA